MNCLCQGLPPLTSPLGKRASPQLLEPCPDKKPGSGTVQSPFLAVRLLHPTARGCSALETSQRLCVTLQTLPRTDAELSAAETATAGMQSGFVHVFPR